MKTQRKTEPITEKNTVPGVAHVKAVATKQFGGADHVGNAVVNQIRQTTMWEAVVNEIWRRTMEEAAAAAKKVLVAQLSRKMTGSKKLQFLARKEQNDNKLQKPSPKNTISDNDSCYNYKEYTDYDFEQRTSNQSNSVGEKCV